jgi:hypothetical protein
MGRVPPVTQSADIATQAEQTPEEKIAAMDAMLAEGLGAYDERLLREQERIKAATPNNNSEGGGGASGGGEGGDGQGGSSDSASAGDGAEGGNQNAGNADGSNSEAQDGEGQAANGPAHSSPGAGAPGSDKDTPADTPADIPDGSDDDIVARQLREAAENETDPELKAKLWDEYRRYKQGIN